MATFLHRDVKANTSGELPMVGTAAPEFRLTKTDLSDIHLSNFKGKRIILNIFPSIDTSTCATSVRKFNQMAAGLSNTIVLCVSKDLPFAHKRFCGAEGIENVVCVSQYKDNSFSNNYHVDIASGSSFIGLMCRSVIVIDENGKVLFTEVVPDIGHEPNYELALSHL